MSKMYTKHNDAFKFKVALEASMKTKTIAELCQKYNIAAWQIYTWKKHLTENKEAIFSDKRKSKKQEVDVNQLHATIGKLKVENDFFANILKGWGTP